MYDAYGAGQSDAAGFGHAGPFGYKAQLGYYTDRSSGLILCTHRFYDPLNGRWLNRDPIGQAGGINLYAYCNNDPVNNADPSGLQSASSGLGPALAPALERYRAQEAAGESAEEAARDQFADMTNMFHGVVCSAVSSSGGGGGGKGGGSGARGGRAPRLPRVRQLYRGEKSSMTPEVVFYQGISPKGTNPSLLDHVSSNSSSNSAGSMYVSTSKSKRIANVFAGKNGYVYVIRTSRGIDVNKALGTSSPFPEQVEVAIPGGVLPGEVHSAYQKQGGLLGNMLTVNSFFRRW